MDLLQTILNAQGGGAVRRIANQLGLDEGQAQQGISALLPALAGAVQQNSSREGGMESLLEALGRGGHQRYLDDPETLGEPATTLDGNAILGHLFGSKEVSRAVASQASAQTGIGADILKKMLPLVASMAMGGLSKGAAAGGMFGAAGAGATGSMGAAPRAEGLLGMLTPILDRDRDGSAIDDVLGMAASFLRKR